MIHTYKDSIGTLWDRKEVTKSILQEVNLDVDIDNLWSRPVGKDAESLVFLQTSYAEINLLIEAQSIGHQTWANKY